MLIAILISTCFLEILSQYYIFKLNGGNPRQISSKFNCNYVGTLQSHHICAKREDSISFRNMLSISRFHPGISNIYYDKKETRASRSYVNDPDISQQWLLSDDTSNSNHRKPPIRTHDLISLWQKGINGTGIVVSIIDDGVDTHHKDLKDNFEPIASFNYLTGEPSPHTEDVVHGTKCAGLISASANNGICGAGAAPGTRFGAIRIMSSSLTEVYDSVEALAFSHKNNFISIYSMSWGPVDDGIKIGKPNELAIRALENGIKQGRYGLGSIYVYSSGNGGRNFDFCGYDGYLQRYEIFVIGSITKEGRMPPYAERCTAILASTLSNSDNSPDNKIYTTQPSNQCGKFHTGTSVSAPIASAIIALVLQVNPKLTYRDIRDLIVKTSIHVDNYPITNAAGYKYSLNYGFGLLDAHALIDLATDVKFGIMPPLRTCQTLYFDVDRSVFYGVLDKSDEGLFDWDIKVMAFYGERSYGFWRLEVIIANSHKAKLLKWGFKVYGSSNPEVNLLKHHSDVVLSLCTPSNIRKDSNLKEWCDKKPSILVRSDGIDPYSYHDSKFLIGSPSSPNISTVVYFTVLSSILILTLVLLHNLHRFISRHISPYGDRQRL
ncbi:hypothetical protein HZS_6509, partial [Henneguya salminicola]